MPTLPVYATNTQVIEAWVKTLAASGVDPTKVGPTLPADMSTWGETGFWQVSTVGGGLNPDLGIKNPVSEISVWAAKPDSNFAPYNRAEGLATQVMMAAQNARAQYLTVRTTISEPEVPEDYTTIFLLGVAVTGMPMRIPDVRTNYARVALHVQAWWDEKGLS